VLWLGLLVYIYLRVFEEMTEKSWQNWTEFDLANQQRGNRPRIQIGAKWKVRKHEPEPTKADLQNELEKVGENASISLPSLSIILRTLSSIAGQSP
jgi:hypothetical protein